MLFLVPFHAVDCGKHTKLHCDTWLSPGFLVVIIPLLFHFFKNDFLSIGA